MTFPFNYLQYLIALSPLVSFLQYYSSDVFPSILKTAKVIPIHKDFKLDFSNYCPISLLSNIEKNPERLIYSGTYKFFSDNNLIYPLQFGFRQKYSTVHVLISLIKKPRGRKY